MLENCRKQQCWLLRNFRAWGKAVNDHDTDELMSLHTEDFRWVPFTQKQSGLYSAGARNFV